MFTFKHLPRLVLSVVLLQISTPTWSLQCATSKCYIDIYNSITMSEFPELSRVKDIHRKLTGTIGSNKAQRSELFVIDTVGHPWAVALSDNSIVMTKGAIDRMYKDSNMELGDARVAFVLGHELSHLDTDDLFHHRAFVANHSGRQLKKSKSRMEEELRADLKGYTYATIAGYRTDLLIGGETDFFRTWLSQIAGTENSTHPDIETRRQFLEKGFNHILKSVPYYKYATALAHFGHYKDSQLLLEDHLNQVETQEAYNNLGYVHIQRARALMPPDIAYRYWIPTLLEPGNKLDLRRTLFVESIPEQALDHLRIAEKMLNYAIDMDESNLTSYINLAAVYLYLPNKLHRAYAAIEDARATPLGKVDVIRDQLESIYQLIRVGDDLDSGDRWPNARDTMVEIASESVMPPANLLFNLARMLDTRGRDETSEHYWQKLHDRIDEIPPAYQSYVCFRLDTECAEIDVKSPWVNNELPLGRDIRYPDIKNYLSANWNTENIPAKQLPGLHLSLIHI